MPENAEVNIRIECQKGKLRAECAQADVFKLRNGINLIRTACGRKAFAERNAASQLHQFSVGSFQQRIQCYYAADGCAAVFNGRVAHGDLRREGKHAVRTFAAQLIPKNVLFRFRFQHDALFCTALI